MSPFLAGKSATRLVEHIDPLGFVAALEQRPAEIDRGVARHFALGKLVDERLQEFRGLVILLQHVLARALQEHHLLELLVVRLGVNLANLLQRDVVFAEVEIGVGVLVDALHLLLKVQRAGAGLGRFVRSRRGLGLGIKPLPSGRQPNSRAEKKRGPDDTRLKHHLVILKEFVAHAQG